MAFPNLYYKRTAATAKACYICYKPTVTVLATVDTSDFFYTCPVHLTDRGFATRAPDPEPASDVKKDKSAVSAEEIARVKQEWDEKQRSKKEKEKKADGGKKDNAEGESKDTGEEKDVADASQEPKTAAAHKSSSLEPSPRPTYERYVLHRDIFALRTADHRRRRQAAQAKDLAPRLPSLPHGSHPPNGS